jgi:branched-chain amino acid transport system substrate-binding protein
MPKMIGKEKINYIVLDDATDPTNAVKNARKLAGEDNVDVFFGPNLITSGLAIADVANEKKVPLLSQAPIVVPPEHKWAFRVEPLADVMVGRVVADMKERGVKTVAFIGFSDSWGELLLKGLTKTTEAAGIRIVATERFGRTDNSVTAQALKLVAAKPDAVFVGGSGTPAVMPHTALRIAAMRADLPFPRRRQQGLPAGRRQGRGGRPPGRGAGAGGRTVARRHPNKQAGLAFDKALEAKYGPESRSSFAGASWDGWLILEGALTTP